MKLEAGDRIIVESNKVGSPTRRGEVVEVLAEGDHPRYRVRWDDGHESVFTPGPDAHAEPAGSR
ncbi:MAG: DUF1918 domain-containing protein [Actinomyces sp.]|nr:MAG: DUF1918 domain-containing protein [Actinomyces sp.]